MGTEWIAAAKLHYYRCAWGSNKSLIMPLGMGMRAETEEVPL
jgi:hypothetical protein